jgi:2-C-methyl-D-erythritol 4-phosphate cytidylyltransferase
VQTPQAFRAQAHKKAYEAPYQPTFTDDASVLESQGFDDIALVEGDPLNIKITNPLDIEIASLYLKHS